MTIQTLGLTLTLFLCLASCTQRKTQDTYSEHTSDSIAESHTDTHSTDSIVSKQAIDTLGGEGPIVCEFRVIDCNPIPDSSSSRVDTPQLDTIRQDSTRQNRDSLSLDTRQYL